VGNGRMMGCFPVQFKHELSGGLLPRHFRCRVTTHSRCRVWGKRSKGWMRVIS
jgi:hypothetical protein